MPRKRSVEEMRVLRARVGRWLLAVTVLASGVSLGSVHTPVLAVCSVVAAAGTALLWYDAEPLEPRPAATLLVAVAVLLIGWSCLQLVPLPHSVLTTIAPENADVWARCLSPLRESGPSWAPISLDPNATRLQVLRGITYLVVFVGAIRVAQRPEGLAFLERALVTSTLVIAAAALLHPALGARKVWGLYEPNETYAYDLHHLGPILNTNQLAGYLNIGVLMAFASVLASRDAIPRPIALVVVLLLGATVVWSTSRGAIGSMLLALILTVLLAFGSRRTRRLRFAGLGAIALVAVAAGSLLLFSLFEETRAKFAANSLFKVQLVQNAFALLRDFGVLGVGRGAFESTFPKVRAGTGYLVFTHPENVIVQWTTEWGLVIAVTALAAIAWALRPQTLLARSRPPIGAWAALVALAAQNLVDFSSEIPGVMIAACVCAAMVSAGSGGGSGRPAPHRRFAFVSNFVSTARNWSRRPRALAIVLVASTLIAVVATLPFVGSELYTEQRSFRELGLDRSVSRDAFHARAREAMLRHPAEPYFPYVGAVRATVVRDESVLPWAGRALERSPIYGRVHLLLARSLYVRNPSQARLEYRIACKQDVWLCDSTLMTAVTEALALVHGYDDAMELVPDGEAGAPILVTLGKSLEQRLPSSVVRLDRELVQRDPRALDPVQRAAKAALHDVTEREPWCEEGARASCVADGLAAARRLRAAAPDKCDGHALAAELRVAAGEVDIGFGELDTALDQVTERSECARRLVSLAVKTNHNVRIDAALDRLLKLGCEAPAECVKNFVFASEIEASRGSHRRSLALARKAWERAPERDDLLIMVAQKAEHQNLHAEALEAYTKLLERHPGDKNWMEAVRREREAATRGVFERR